MEALRNITFCLETSTILSMGKVPFIFIIFILIIIIDMNFPTTLLDDNRNIGEQMNNYVDQQQCDEDIMVNLDHEDGNEDENDDEDDDENNEDFYESLKLLELQSKYINECLVAPFIVSTIKNLKEETENELVILKNEANLALKCLSVLHWENNFDKTDVELLKNVSCGMFNDHNCHHDLL